MRPPLFRFRDEWPTWAALAGCYGLWAAVIGSAAFWTGAPFGWLWIPAATLAAAFQSSLCHEILHGHPTRSRRINEALVLPALGLFIPFRRFRDLHLRHHHDARLTDPYDDPETWYVAEGDWRRASAPMRALLRVNGTLAGRVIVGPALSLAAFWAADARAIARGDRAVLGAWARHGIGVGLVVGVLLAAGVPPALYVACVAYPAMSLLMVRTFIEHRAAEATPERTAVVEAGPLTSLLFLNNNLHAVHHRFPAVAWHRLPARWRRDRKEVLRENADYHYPGGYIEVARAWLLRRREPVVHPHVRRERSKSREIA